MVPPAGSFYPKLRFTGDQREADLASHRLDAPGAVYRIVAA